MCEYCGCQSLETIAELTDEHDRLRSLGRDLSDAATAGDRVSAATVAERMLAVLGPHTAVEEGGLFPAMAEDFPTQISDLHADHERIDAALTGIARGVADDWAVRSLATVNELFEHILKEQDGVFPAALSTLSSAQWERVAAVRTGTAALEVTAGSRAAPPRSR